MEKCTEMAPDGARRICFLLIQTLPTFCAERICIVNIFNLLVGLQISRLLDFKIPSCQLAWLAQAQGGGTSPAVPNLRDARN